MEIMETRIRKVGNSLGMIFPKETHVTNGEEFMIYQIDDFFILKPKKENIFKNAENWQSFKETMTSEETEWENMEVSESEWTTYQNNEI